MLQSYDVRGVAWGNLRYLLPQDKLLKSITGMGIRKGELEKELSPLSCKEFFSHF